MRGGMRTKHLELDEEDRGFTVSVREAAGFALTNRSDEGLNWGLLFDPPGLLEVIDQWTYEAGPGYGSTGEIVFVCEGKKTGQTRVIARLYRPDGLALDEREMIVNVRAW